LNNPQEQPATSIKLHAIVPYYFVFWCPGCNRSHAIAVKGYAVKPTWDWNEYMSAPTFNPSLLVMDHREPKVCHFFVRDGKIMYLADSQHKLAGHTVEMPDWQE
jgi:hypothetical protein